MKGENVNKNSRKTCEKYDIYDIYIYYAKLNAQAIKNIFVRKKSLLSHKEQINLMSKLISLFSSCL